MVGPSIGKVFRSIEEEMKKYVEVDSFYLPKAGAKPLDLLCNIKAACRKANSKAYDVIHITGSEHYLTYFLSRKHKVIVTVHDLCFFTNAPKTPRTIMLYLFWIKTLKYADKITCISNKTQQEVEHLVSLKQENQVCTINNPIGKEFQYKPKKINEEYPIVLHIGTKPNKNLSNTILALHDFPHHLRIIGRLTEEQKQMLQINRVDYSNAYNLTDEEIKNEYAKCDIVNFPSLYEGFGMPIIEAQAVGRVVVTSNLSPMREIAGDGAILVNPTDTNSILSGYKSAIEKSNIYIHKGLDNVKRFQIETITQQYYKLYKELI